MTPPPGGDQPTITDEQWFERFWEAYPKKERRIVAEAAFRFALREAEGQALVHGAEGYARKVAVEETESKYIQGADRWLRDKRWTDEYPPPARAQRPWHYVAE